MYPVLIKLGSVNIYSYGFMIMLGLVGAFLYVRWVGKKAGITTDDVSGILLWCVVGVVVGGKLFYILEDPKYHLSHMGDFFSNFGNGFVFYGSFLCTIPILIWQFKKFKLPVWQWFDEVGIGGAFVHGTGKIGCFLAGCCFGKVCPGKVTGVIYTNPLSAAEPLNKALYPTQLWDAAIIYCIIIAMLLAKKRKVFNGQLFLMYGLLYAIGRFFTEQYRGDESRGFVTLGGLLPDRFLSHSQLIALAIMVVCLILGYILWKKQRIKNAV